MKLIRYHDRWDPFQELEDLTSRMNRVFGLTRWPGLGEHEALATTEWTPSCDITETDTEYRIRAELPDVKREDVHVTMERGILTIRGERKDTKDETGVRVHRRELTYGSFLRRFTMPDDADENKIVAAFTHGILDVTVAKTKVAAPTVREIAIR